MGEVAVGDLYDTRSTLYESVTVNGKDLYSCSFCEKRTYSGGELLSNSTVRTHAAAHRIAFEILMENNPLMVCPVCETPVVSDLGIRAKSNEVLYNDMDLISHLETEHYDSLESDFLAEFDQLSYLLTTFRPKSIGSLSTFSSEEASTSENNRGKQASRKLGIPVSIIRCSECAWTSRRDGEVYCGSVMVDRVKNHLLEHLESGFRIEEGERSDSEAALLWQAQNGALKLHFQSSNLGDSADISQFPYADRLTVLYTNTLVKLFGLSYPLVMRILHGIRGNPFKSKKTKGFDYETATRMRGHTQIARGMQALQDIVSTFDSDKRVARNTQCQSGPCARVECGHAILDFTDGEAIVSHVFAHIRHDEARLSVSLEGVAPLVCKCGMQVFSPIALLMHICDEHLFDHDVFVSGSQHDTVSRMAAHIVFSYAQSCLRGRQKCRDKTVLTEWLARMGLQHSSGAEENWAMVDAAVDSEWAEKWRQFVEGEGAMTQGKIQVDAKRELEVLFSTIPFGSADSQFIDPAKQTYQEVDPVEQFNRVRRMFTRITNQMANDKSKWLMRKKIERNNFDVRRREDQRVRNQRRRGCLTVGPVHVPTTANAAVVHPAHKCANAVLVDRNNPGSSTSGVLEESGSGMDSPCTSADESTDLVVVSSSTSGVVHTEVISLDEDPQPGPSTSSTSPSSSIPVIRITPSARFKLPKAKVSVSRRGIYVSPVKSYAVKPSIPDLLAVCRVHCKTCKHTSFPKDDAYMLKLHAAAHAILLVRITSPTFAHAPDGVSCPGCVLDNTRFYTGGDFDISNTIRHLMRRHADACMSVYNEYLQEKFPSEMFVCTELELHRPGRIVFRCQRGGCITDGEVCSLDRERPLLCVRDADIPVLKHLLWHVRSDKGLDLEPTARETLARFLAFRMSQLSERNLAVHVKNFTAKYTKEKQADMVKFLLSSLRSVVCSVFGLEAAWVMQIVLPVYSLRSHMETVFPECTCLICSLHATKRDASNMKCPSVAFSWNPVLASLHALSHQLAGGLLPTTTQPPSIPVPDGSYSCPLCDSAFDSGADACHHLISAHVMIVTTGLLYPLLESMSCVSIFVHSLELSYGEQSWQLLHVLSFPDQHPRTLQPSGAQGTVVKGKHEQRKRTKAAEITVCGPLKKSFSTVPSTSSDRTPADSRGHACLRRPKERVKEHSSGNVPSTVDMSSKWNEQESVRGPVLGSEQQQQSSLLLATVKSEREDEDQIYGESVDTREEGAPNAPTETMPSNLAQALQALRNNKD